MLSLHATECHAIATTQTQWHRRCDLLFMGTWFFFSLEIGTRQQALCSASMSEKQVNEITSSNRIRREWYCRCRTSCSVEHVCLSSDCTSCIHVGLSLQTYRWNFEIPLGLKNNKKKYSLFVIIILKNLINLLKTQAMRKKWCMTNLTEFTYTHCAHYFGNLDAIRHLAFGFGKLLLLGR